MKSSTPPFNQNCHRRHRRQVRTDGTRGVLRSLEQACAIYEQNLPPLKPGGSQGLNQTIGDRPMTEAEVTEAEDLSEDIAKQAPPASTVACSARSWRPPIAWPMPDVFHDGGCPDLNPVCEEKIGEDIAEAALNGVVHGTAVAASLAVLGTNPLTAGIGLVTPEAITLLTRTDGLTAWITTQGAGGGGQERPGHGACLRRTDRLVRSCWRVAGVNGIQTVTLAKRNQPGLPRVY